MWSTHLFGVSFFDLYVYFMMYSFLGWLMESIYVSVKTKGLVNRGFLSGPFCPIYGTGALLIVLTLTPVVKNLLLLFLGGFLIATVVEYLIGAALEKLFHATWWDYSKMPFNIKGRVCLERSAEWGLLSVFMMRVLQPAIVDITNAIPRTWGEWLGTILLAYLVVDSTITVLNVLRLNEKLATLSEAHAVLREKLENTKFYGTRKEIVARFESMTAMEMLRDWKERLEEQQEEIEQMWTEERLRWEYLMNDIREKMEYRMRALTKMDRTQQRLLRAFPDLRSIPFDDELKAWKRELKERKKGNNKEDVSE